MKPTKIQPAAMQSLTVIVCFFLSLAKCQIETDSTHSDPESDDDSGSAVDVTDPARDGDPTTVKFCTFFNNRAPTPQPDVKNCTWYKEESCCTQIEIDETFKNMKPLQGANERCQRYINYLMCYICSPRQHIFYMYQRLIVCKEFCDLILMHCMDAILKGTHIRNLYKNGTQFCESRNLEVAKRNHNECFYFDENDDDKAPHDSGDSLKLEPKYIIVLNILIGLVVTHY